MGNLILALDKQLSLSTLSELSKYISKIKIGYPLILENPSYLDNITKIQWDEVIFDLKLADIDNTMMLIASKLLNYADSFIAHSFIGVEGALDNLSSYLKKHEKSLYLVLSMSHKGWNDGFYSYLKEVAIKVNPDGFVVGATKPNMIRTVRNDFKDKVIISPGVGVQGANIGDAICNGADYEIVGRSIYEAKDPVTEAKRILEIQEGRIRECKGSEN
ncbi:orotidine 5'-phosphate decarboxylase [Sulfurisphaera javensis]|uniref:Orotidine 5'-phosphate decarboxylase n=1 Tax=Sulfurisphaera javensis TaxID=2049879 RepID=A0AAT9GUE4_9CREN